MAKDAFYFSHDSNARNDDRIIAVRMKFNMEGYGIFFAILERLRESEGYKCIKDYNMIAFDLRVSTDKVKSIVEDFGLFVFTEDGKYFYSESFNRRMIPLENTREQRRQAGLKSAEKRAKNKQPFNDRSTTVDKKTNKGKESKGKESKEESNATPAWKTFPDKDNLPLELPEVKSGAVIQQAKFTGKGDWTIQQVIGLWDVFKAQNFTGEKHYRSENDVYSHFINWCKSQTVVAAAKSSISGFSDKDVKAIFG